MPETVKLPAPKKPATPLYEALEKRRSKRRFADGSISLAQISLLCRALQGVTHPRGYRTAPSAGALYPLECRWAFGPDVEQGPGVFHYRPHDHELVKLSSRDIRERLADAALHQGWTAQAQAMLVISAVFSRVTGKYGLRGEQYVHIEAGCAAQNAALQAAALNLGTTVVGAFNDGSVHSLLHAPDEEQPLIIMPVGII